MVCGISEHMHQRITDLVHHSAVKLRILTCHVQLHLLAKLLGQIPDHARELGNDALDGHHSHFHNRFVQVCRHALEILDLLVDRTVVSLVLIGCRCRDQRILGDDQLADQVHQIVKFLDINPDRPVHYRFRSRLIR